MASGDYYLEVPKLGISQRRSSEGYLNANELLSNCEHPFDERETEMRRRRGTNPSLFDGHFLDALKKNYQIASAVADIEDSKEYTKKLSKPRRHSMVRGGPVTRTASPRPLIIQQHLQNKWRNDESTSISSTDTNLDEIPSPTENSRNVRWDWLRKEAKTLIDDIIDAFEAGCDTRKESFIAENEKLSAVQLRKDLKRFYLVVHPYLEVAAALYDLIMWKSPLSTLLLVLVVIYSLFRGWTLSLLFALLLFQLSLNYLTAVRKINIGWMFLPRKQVLLPKFDISGAQLIFDIAKLAQKLLRFATNILEKLESLFMWKNYRVSRVFTGLAIYWLAWTILFSAGTCIGWTVLAFGVRIFFTTYLFQKFPRLRARFDTYGYFYRNLPLRSVTTTKAAANSTIASSKSDKNFEDDRCQSPSGSKIFSSCSGEKFSSRLGSNFNLDQSAAINLLLKPNYKYSQVNSPIDSSGHLEFSLADGSEQGEGSTTCDSPPQLHGSISSSTSNEISSPRSYSESCTRSRTTTSKSSSVEDDEDDNDHMSQCTDQIIDNVIAFRSCVMNEREKLFPLGITSGILYLTDSALIFRPRHNSEEKDQMMILFHDLKSVRKIQSLRSMSLITGTRKSLEFHVDGRRKPVQFIGIAKRDDFVTRIQLMCRNNAAIVNFTE